MSIRRVASAAFTLSLCLAASAAPAFAAEKAEDPPIAEEAAAAPSPVARELADWAAASGDNQGLPFAIVDKALAYVFVFDASGVLLGGEPALIGEAVGDDSVPGIGDRPLSKIRPHERTTPAGRFVAAFGPALGQKEETLWVDYGTAVSLHPVVTNNRKERRVKRLKSPTPEDNRITYGCINVSHAFYKAVVRPTFQDTKGVFYILPDSKALDEVFPDFGVQARVADSGERRPGRGSISQTSAR